MPAFDFETFADNGIIREKALREAFSAIDWESYRDQTVHVRACGEVTIPTWAFLMVAARLAQVARKITYGEDQAPIPVFERTSAPSPQTGIVLPTKDHRGQEDRRETNGGVCG